MKKKLLAAVMAGKTEANTEAAQGKLEKTDTVKVAASSGEKQDLVIMITNPGDVNNEVEQRLIEKLGDKYNIITKTWDSASVEQTVKTAAAADEQIDLVQYWPNR